MPLLIDWKGALRPADPDGLVVQAGFLPLAEAIGRLEDIPWRVILDPTSIP